MNKKDKEITLQYINLLAKETVGDRIIAEDLDEKIAIELKNIPKITRYKLMDLMGKRIKFSKAIIKKNESIHKIIEYVAAEGYEVKWKEYTAIDLIKNDNFCDTNPFENSKLGG